MRRGAFAGRAGAPSTEMAAVLAAAEKVRAALRRAGVQTSGQRALRGVTPPPDEQH